MTLDGSSMPLIEFWYHALRSKIGIIISVRGDRDKFRARLYEARKKAMDIDLDRLAIVRSPTSQSELWIMKRTLGD